MSDAVVYEQLDEGAPAGGAAPADAQSDGPVSGAVTGPAGTGPTVTGPAVAGSDQDLRRLSDVPLELSVEIGRTRMTVGETLGLRPGSIVTLERLAGEPVDLLVNGTPIARGEVVVVDEQFGLRVRELIEDDAAARALAEEHDDDASDADAGPGAAAAPAGANVSAAPGGPPEE